MSYQIPDNEKPIMSILSYSLPYRKFSDTKVSIANTLPQTLFSFQRVNNFNADLGLKLTKDYQCQLEGTGATFDCTKFQDSDWHLITLRRNTYKTLDVMIDTNVIVSYKDYN